MIRQQPFASPSEALQHYGTKGMKWGVRKEPKTSGDGSAGEPVTAIIGAAWVAIFLASTVHAVRTSKVYADESGEVNQQKTANVAWKKKPELSKKMSIDELHDNVVKQINPKFGRPGTKMNCRRCTFTYEMRRRGYDVKATRSIEATGQDLTGLKTATMAGKKDYQSLWGQKQVADPVSLQAATSQQRSDAIFSSLAKEPNGSRGELAVGWQFGGGHSMAYEIVNNKPVIFDTQSQKTYRDSKSFRQFSTIVTEAAHTRTDNIKLDEDFLKRWVVNND